MASISSRGRKVDVERPNKILRRQVINFMIGRKKERAYLMSLPHLIGYMRELKAALNTSTLVDKHKLRSDFKDVADHPRSVSFLMEWSILEVARHVVMEKFASDTTADVFLKALRLEICSRVTLGEKVAKLALINFLSHIDEFVQDRIATSSTGRWTYDEPSDLEQWFKANSSILETWFLKNRHNIALLSLAADNPAECWRNISIKLNLDLATKYNSLNSTDPSTLRSFSQTIMSLDLKNWNENLKLIALCAKQLGDRSLLCGLQDLSEKRGVISEYKPIKAIISNLDGCYQRTYDTLRNSKDLEQQSLVEFLNSCIELDLLFENADSIDELKSVQMRVLYKKYLESKSQCLNTVLPHSRIQDVKRWLETWNLYNGRPDVQPTKNYLDLIIPTCLNFVVRTENDERSSLIQLTEALINQDWISQCLFPLNMRNPNIKIYNVLLELLKNGRKIDSQLVKANSSNLSWNQLLYRHISDLNLIEKLRHKSGNEIDLIQIRAAKFHFRNKNITLGKRIADDLHLNASLDKTKLQSNLFLLQDDLSSAQKCDILENVLKNIANSGLENTDKSDLYSRVARYILKLNCEQLNEKFKIFDIPDESPPQDSAVQEIPNEWPSSWRNLLGACDSISKIKTMLLVSERLNENLRCSLETLNHTFDVDLKLLELLCQANSPKYKLSALECATRILSRLKGDSLHLDNRNLERIKSENFIQGTMDIWVVLKRNLISLATSADCEISNDWHSALVKIIGSMARTHPDLLIYHIIVNRLDLQHELLQLDDESVPNPTEPSAAILLESPFVAGQRQEVVGKLRDFRKKLNFWNELLQFAKASIKFEDQWSEVVAETERFLKEIRKISFLPGEYMKYLARRIPAKLGRFMQQFSKLCDPNTGSISDEHYNNEYERRLKNVCENSIRSIHVLSSLGERFGKSQLTPYEVWFCDKFGKHMEELKYRLRLLAGKKPLVLRELDRLTKTIIELLSVFQLELDDYNHLNRHKLMMEVISPVLSRLQPSRIPMPEFLDGGPQRSFQKPLVTIHKVSQNVDLIVSKTFPKKIKFTGSDGVSRSFLLKAHEDLRLDELIMEVFASINSILAGSKETRGKFRIRRYAVTPVTSRSGLIQWIDDSSSLGSIFRRWLHSSNGLRFVESIYSQTCKALCDDEYSFMPSASHRRCLPQQGVRSSDLFYQLLWAETKPTKRPLTEIRPFPGNCHKYREEFDNSVFESVVDQLIDRVPGELVSNILWHQTTHSHSYWLKTQEFIHSCATMSIVGYLIGLGDRHAENILLDVETGEVVHIDYSICFEAGKNLSTPEQVPFRLTQNIIHAFGFAGVEGGFKYSCRSVLNALKGSKSTLLYLLDPINMSFMSESNGTKETHRVSIVQPHADVGSRVKAATISPTHRVASVPNRATINPNIDIQQMDMCSQESEVTMEMSKINGDDEVLDLLTVGHLPSAKGIPVPEQPAKQQAIGFDLAASFDLQDNIKSPAKISKQSAQEIYGRIRDKLNGSDEYVRKYKFKKGYAEGLQVEQTLTDLPETSSQERGKDLIVLNDAQTTEDQVDALIASATSLKNLAKMYEGWMAWV